MATFRCTVDGVCAGGGHILLGIWRDNVKIKQIGVDKTHILAEIDFEAALITLLYLVIKKSGASTPAQMKTAIEAASWEV